VGEGHRVGIGGGEDAPCAQIEVGGGNVEFPLGVTKRIALSVRLQNARVVPLELVEREHAGRKALLDVVHELEGRRANLPLDAVDEVSRHRQPHVDRGREDGPAVHVVHVAPLELQRGIRIGEERPVHLPDRDPLGEHAGHRGARAHADVDVEPGRREVEAEEVVERRQAADLVVGAGQPAAGEAQGDPFPLRARVAPAPEDGPRRTGFPYWIVGVAQVGIRGRHFFLG